MNGFALALQALELTAAAMSAAAAARRVYEGVRAQAERTNEFTPEQVAELDAKAEAIFASAAQQESGR